MVETRSKTASKENTSTRNKDINNANIQENTQSSLTTELPINRTMTLSIETAEKMLIRFDGTRSLLFEFIDNCDTALSNVNDTNKPILFSIIRTKLTGRAREVTRNREIPNWEFLKNHLLELYSDRRTQAQWQLELNSCKQRFNEDVSTYGTRIENCYTKCINSLSTTLSTDARKACVDLFKNQALNVFITGLTKDLSLLVKAQKPDSLEDAISIALNEEQEFKSKIETQKFRNPSDQYCNYCRKPGHTLTNCRNKHKKHVNVHHIRNTPKTPPNQYFSGSTNRSNQPLGPKVCFYCKNPGHLIGECRKRQRNNNMYGNMFNNDNRTKYNNYSNNSRYSNPNRNTLNTNDSNDSDHGNDNLNYSGPSSSPAPLKAKHVLQAGLQQ